MLCTLLPNDHGAVGGTGDRAADVDQIALRVDLLDAKPDGGVACGAVVTRHALALDDARGIGARSDRARLPMLGVAVGVGTTADAVALHDALKAVSLAGAGDLHQLALLEHVDLHQVADVVGGDLRLRVPRSEE